jgi:hypothetical protein
MEGNPEKAAPPVGEESGTRKYDLELISPGVYRDKISGNLLVQGPGFSGDLPIEGVMQQPPEGESAIDIEAELFWAAGRPRTDQELRPGAAE